MQGLSLYTAFALSLFFLSVILPGATTTAELEAECSVGHLQCPLPGGDLKGYDYTILGSEGAAAGTPCGVKHNGTVRFFSFLVSECNSSTVMGHGKETYHATLVPVSMGPIEFLGVPSINCRCEVITVAATSTAIFAPQLQVYTTDSFSVPMAVGDTLPPSDKLFLEVQSDEAGDHIGMLQCLAAPSSDEQDVDTRTLVDESCDSGIFGVHLLESPSGRVLRMESKVFKFRTSDTVYIRCNVMRCPAGSATCGACQPGRRLREPTPDSVTVGLAVVWFGVSASNGQGNFSILELGGIEGPVAPATAAVLRHYAFSYAVVGTPMPILVLMFVMTSVVTLAACIVHFRDSLAAICGRLWGPRRKVCPAPHS